VKKLGKKGTKHTGLRKFQHTWHMTDLKKISIGCHGNPAFRRVGRKIPVLQQNCFSLTFRDKGKKGETTLAFEAISRDQFKLVFGGFKLLKMQQSASTPDEASSVLAALSELATKAGT
jgi:hypothetical protein